MHDRTARGNQTWVAAAAAAVMLTACGGGPAKPPRLVQARGGDLAPLMTTVPADAGMVIHVAPGLVELFSDDFADEFRTKLAEEPDEPGTVGAALQAELGRAPSMMAAVGWRPGQSEVLMWAKGKTVMARARLDGVALRGLIERAEQQSGKQLARATWHGRAFLTWDGTEGTRVYARIDEAELVVVLSESREQALPLLMDEAPAARRFDPQPVIAALFPGRADAHFGAMLDPAWLIEIAGDELLRLGPDQGCVRAAVDLVAGLPPLHYAWARSDAATEIAAAVKLAPDTAAQLERGLAPIPHWPIDERYLTVGLGLSMRTAVEIARPWAERVDLVAKRCGQSPQAVTGLAMIAALPAVTQVERGSMIMEPRSESFALAVAPIDLPRFWAALGALAPLRPLAPAPGERLEIAGAVVTSDGTSLLAAQGTVARDEMLRELATAPPGPSAVVAMVMGKSVLAQLAAENGDADSRQFLGWVSGMALELGLRDGHLVSRAVFRHR